MKNRITILFLFTSITPKSKVFKFVISAIPLLFSQNTFAQTQNPSCLNFDLRPQKRVLSTPVDIDNIVVFKSSQVAGPGNRMFFIDYSKQPGDATEQHAFVECKQLLSRYYQCASEDYSFDIDLRKSKPILSFQFLTISDLDEPYQQISSRTKGPLKIEGDRERICSKKSMEQFVIEG